MERIDSMEGLRVLNRRGRPLMSNCYHMLRGFERAMATGRLYARQEEGYLLLLEEWPDVFQVYAYVYEADCIPQMPRTQKPLLAECVARDGQEDAMAGFWMRAGFRSACTRLMLEGAADGSASRSAAIRVHPASEAELEAVRMLFAAELDRLTVRLPWHMEAPNVLCAADETGRLAGALHFSCASGTSTLEHLAVVPQLRRHGVGGALLDAWMRSVPAHRLRLWVIRDNMPARALYKSRGFSEAGRYCTSFLYEE